MFLLCAPFERFGALILVLAPVQLRIEEILTLLGNVVELLLLFTSNIKKHGYKIENNDLGHLAWMPNIFKVIEHLLVLKNSFLRLRPLITKIEVMRSILLGSNK